MSKQFMNRNKSTQKPPPPGEVARRGIAVTERVSSQKLYPLSRLTATALPKGEPKNGFCSHFINSFKNPV